MKLKINKLVSLILTIVLIVSAFSCIQLVASAESSYINDGKTIEFFKSVTVNLKNQKADDIPGKLFVGWQKQDNTWPKANASYKSGDVLTAKYIDFAESSFAITGFAVKNSSGLKLRIAYAKTAALDSIPNVSESGVIWAKTDAVGGRELRVDESVVRSWWWTNDDRNGFMPENVLGEPEKTNANVAVIALTAANYDTFYTARGFIKYKDKNGVENVLYTDEETTSAYKVSKEIKTPDTNHKAIITAVEKANKKYVDSITEQIVTTYTKGSTYTGNTERHSDSYEEFSNLYDDDGNSAKKRTVYLEKTGIKEAVNLGWLSDSHFNYVNQTDVDKQMINALSSYRGRTWLRDGSSINTAIFQFNYANKRYKKTVVTGDMVDYLSYGSLYTTKALIADKSINGSILMTTGNHEFAEACQPDIDNLASQMTLAQKYELLSAAWAHDPTYYAEILKTSKGEDNAMIIILDNGQSSGNYADGTAEKLTASLATARSKNIPVLIFQHVGMPTFNAKETTVYYNNDISYMGFGTKESNSGSFNMSSYYNRGEEAHTIIRKNYDIIKGVFCGHEHAHLYSEITALNEDGSIIPNTYIPQFITTSSAYGWVNEIVLEMECDHTYSTPCDSECNKCHKNDYSRDHEYDGYCDNKCNKCGAVRIANDHTFSSATDKYCDECGAARIFGTSFEKNGSDYYYYVDQERSFETGLVKVNGKWFYVKRGIWDTSYTGLYKKNGKWLYVANGRWSAKTDLIKYEEKYFLVVKGQWSSTKNTLYKKSGKFFAIKNGKWYKYKTIISYSGKKFYCNKGFAQLGFNGKVKIGTKTYTVKKGQVK